MFAVNKQIEAKQISSGINIVVRISMCCACVFVSCVFKVSEIVLMNGLLFFLSVRAVK